MSKKCLNGDVPFTDWCLVCSPRSGSIFDVDRNDAVSYRVEVWTRIATADLRPVEVDLGGDVVSQQPPQAVNAWLPVQFSPFELMVVIAEAETVRLCTGCEVVEGFGELVDPISGGVDLLVEAGNFSRVWNDDGLRANCVRFGKESSGIGWN
jgi:hypothetical protein